MSKPAGLRQERVRHSKEIEPAPGNIFRVVLESNQWERTYLNMSDFLTSLVAVVAVLGFMILIHEFGHYAVAKWLGVRVEQFAIGFGKRLIGFRKGETDYRINAIPLGGYVKMSGENPDGSSAPTIRGSS